MNHLKHKSKYSCESAIYFKLGSEINKQNCNFAYYFKKTDIKPTVLDGRNGINVNNDIPVKTPSFPYVLVSRSLLCNCRIEVENNFILESLAPCQDAKI